MLRDYYVYRSRTSTPFSAVPRKCRPSREWHQWVKPCPRRRWHRIASWCRPNSISPQFARWAGTTELRPDLRGGLGGRPRAATSPSAIKSFAMHRSWLCACLRAISPRRISHQCKFLLFADRRCRIRIASLFAMKLPSPTARNAPCATQRRITVAETRASPSRVLTHGTG